MLTAPILITALAVPLLGEKVGWHRWQAIVVGLLGALIIVRPDLSLQNIGNILVVGSAITSVSYTHLTLPTKA